MIEDRLRAAFTALADTVDSPPPGLRRPVRRAPAIAAAAAVVVTAAGAWAVFQSEAPQAPPISTTSTPSTPSTPPSATSQQPVVIPYELYTHCGIDDASVNGIFYEAETPIPEPLQGWGNPYQMGTMTLVSPSEVIFRDDLGHVVRFRARPGATAFKRVCA
jgi:hypothetical protein